MWYFIPLILVLSYYALTRLIVWMVSYFIMRCYDIKIQICSISILHFCFKDLLIEKGPVSIKIDRVGAASSLFNQDEKKILAFKLYDVRIEKKVRDDERHGSPSKNTAKSDVAADVPGPLAPEEDEWHEAFDETFLPDLPPPQRFKISASVVTLAQFFGVRLLNVSVMWLRSAWPSCLLHVTAERLELEASTLNQTNMALTVNVQSCHVKMLQPVGEKLEHASSDTVRGGESAHQAARDPSAKDWGGRGLASMLGSFYGSKRDSESFSHDPSLLECSFSSKFYAQVDAEHDAYMETLSLDLKSVCLDIRDRLFVFLQVTSAARSAMRHEAVDSMPPPPTQHVSAPDDDAVPTSIAAAFPRASRVLSQYWNLVPQNVNLNIEDVTMNVTSHPTHSNVLAQLNCLQFTLRIPRALPTLQAVPAQLLELYSSFYVDDVRLNSSHHSFLALRTLRSDSSHLGRRIVCGAEVHFILYWFDHRDLAVFLPYLSCLLQAARSARPAVESKRKKKKLLPLLRTFYDSSHVVIELWDVGVGVKLPCGPPLLLSLFHASLDTGTGDFLVEAFTSLLGKECCCVRPLRLAECYCEAASSCTTGRCRVRRHSGGDLRPSPEPCPDTRHRRSVGHEAKERVTSSFLGQYGTQNFYLSLADLKEHKIGLSRSPCDELHLLSEQRGDGYQQTHLWGSPMSLGFFCVHFSPGSVFHEAFVEKPSNLVEGGLNFGDVGGRNYDGCRQRYFSKGETPSTSGLSGTFYRQRMSSAPQNESPKTEDRSDVTSVRLDHLQLEWSPAFANFVQACVSYAHEIQQIVGWGGQQGSAPAPLRPSRASSAGETLKHVSLDCSNINIFAHTKYDQSLMLRCDNVRSARPCTALFHGLKLVLLVPQKLPFDCLPAAQIQDCCTVADMGVVSVVLSGADTLLEMQEQCVLQWQAAVHLTVLAAVLDLQELHHSLSTSRAWPAQRRVADASPAPKKDLRLQLVAKGCVGVLLTLSERHEALLKMEGLTYLTARGLTCIEAARVDVHLDRHKMMSLVECKLASSFKSMELQREREAFPELEQPLNRAWRVTFTEWNITFPYEFDFAEAFHEDMLSLVKWLKTMHRNAKKVNSQERTGFSSPAREGEEVKPVNNNLPPDIIVKVNKWVVSVEDDPFEVKLRYNYELMEDEYQESCKRKKAFNSRIHELQRTGAFLTTSKMEELHKSLKEKDSETYIKRSKQMYESAPVRSPLFTWVVEDLVGFALADPTLHGKNNVLQNLKDIDPYPFGDEEFSTLWCRVLSVSVGHWQLVLRDYPQPLLDVTTLEMWGRLVCAEQCAPHKRGERTVLLPLPQPWHDGKVVRCLAPRKFYHDLTWEAATFTLAYGPCWEPAMSQFNLALSKINSRPVDPSLPLPWWDKVRLLFHGRLLLLAQNFTLKLHASLDPYNTTEEMELTWTDLTLDWVNAKLDFAGDLNVFVRTASKYDDARLLRLPNLRLEIKLHWICYGDPNDHHAVMLCAPDKLPEYSSNQEHDSYRSFRSRNLDMNINLETRSLVRDGVHVNPVIEMLFYGSTLRWFENLKFILSGVTRPIRRGRVFGNTAPRKPQLSRHYRTIHLALALQRFDVRYWLSVGVKKGFHLSGERLSLSSEHSLVLTPRSSGLRQRSLSRWSVVYLNTELLQAQVWLQSVLTGEETVVGSEEEEDGGQKSDTKKASAEHQDGTSSVHKMRPDSKGSGKKEDKVADGADAGVPKGETDQDSCRRKMPQPPQPPQVEKFYFLHVNKVAYMRETLSADPLYMSGGLPSETPQHRLVVHHLKGAWTTHNRDIVLALYDSWTKSQQLKHNLRPDVLQSFSGATRNSASSAGRPQPVINAASPAATTATLHTPGGLESTPSPLSRLHTGGGAELLHQLIKEADNNKVAYSEDCSNTSEQPRDSHSLHGVADCTMDDVVCKRWLIELVNSQVLLKGCETQGYVILSAANSQVIQRIHRPAWRQQTLNSKTTWYGSLGCMQYYATVSPSHSQSQMDNIMWLSVANIEERGDAQEPLDLTDIVGSNQCAGGVVTDTVGGAQLDKSGHSHDMQLQRIVSRCRCEFYYVCYGELGVEPELLGEVQPPPPNTDELWGDHRDPTDTFTLMHHDLCISTNSLQYNMVVDILNKLLLYVDPVKKAASSALARMRFQLQLSSGEDQKKPIVKLQNQLRNQMSQLRALEKDVYLVQRALDREPHREVLSRDMSTLTKRVASCKERLAALSQELAIRIHCYNESLLRANHKMSMAQGDKVTTIRMNEVFFRKAQWRLTEDDGQLGIAEVALSNFLYTKKNNSDDSGEHLMELGYVNMKNLLPNQAYSDVLAPTTLTSTCPLDRQKTLRIFCREKPPCGGISVIDHFEINVVPLDISLTYQFYKTILKFCFPDNAVVVEESDTRRRPPVRRAARPNKDSHFYVQLHKDDVEIMKQRAEQNKMFVYIKIPELKIRLSYKGMKEKNLTDVTNFRLVVPSLEYHNVTWTWLDFLNGLKEHCKSALVPQVIKIKLNVLNKGTDATAQLDEEAKARLLLGDRRLPQSARTSKKTLFKFKK